MVGSIRERVWATATGVTAVAPALEEIPAESESPLTSSPEEGFEEVAAVVGRQGAASASHARFREFYATRDSRLRAALIMEHNGLAQSIARRFSWPGLTSEDLLQIARIGL